MGAVGGNAGRAAGYAAGAKAMKNDSEKNLGSAIVGLFAAIKICRRLGYDPAEVLRLVEQMTEEWGLLPAKQDQTAKAPEPSL
jgi:hypothetical protein